MQLIMTQFFATGDFVSPGLSVLVAWRLGAL